jgi:hypothetical protein
MPSLGSLRVYDNTEQAPPSEGSPPNPKLLLHMEDRIVLNREALIDCSAWAKPIARPH